MYNKAEALQEKEVAEKLINATDYVSARDRLIKAQQLFPSLDHIVGMLTVCDVLSASKTKIPGYDIDYYWILHLMPSCNFTDLSCRHQKLHKLMIPIKNKFSGTELALKLIEDAFSVLSDAEKRSVFDSKRKTSWEGYESVIEDSAFCHNVSNREAGVSAQISSGYDRVSSGEISEGNKWNVKDWGPELHVNSSLQEPSACSSTVNSEGNNLEEIDMPVDDVEESKRFDQEFYNFGSTRTLECFETGQIWAAAQYQSDELQNHRYAQINAVLTSTLVVTWLKPVPISDGERKWCDAGLPVASGPFCMDLQNSEKVISPMVFSYICTWVCGVTEEQFEIYPKKGEVWALYEGWDLDEWSYNRETVKGCKFKLVEFLSDFSKYLGADCVCLVKADGFNSIFQRITNGGKPVVLHISPNNLYMLSHRVPTYRFMDGEINGVTEGMFELDQLALPNETVNDMDVQTMSKVEISDSSNKPDTSNWNEPIPSHSSLKKYPESKILGPNWFPNDFIAGQVWAVYDEKDFPRHYTQIKTVSSTNQVRVTYLEPQPILDYEFAWKKERLPVVCGVYGATGPTVNLDRSHFSHLVRCQRSTTNSIYKIYPMKGEIWAMYKNWINKWKQFQYENAEFDFAEILSDFSEGSGMRIARLVEVDGCLTFFQKQQFNGFDLTRVVPQSDVVGFSHRIPAFRVPGIGQHGIPESSWHLEPNALPCKHESEA